MFNSSPLLFASNCYRTKTEIRLLQFPATEAEIHYTIAAMFHRGPFFRWKPHRHNQYSFSDVSLFLLSDLLWVDVLVIVVVGCGVGRWMWIGAEIVFVLLLLLSCLAVLIVSCVLSIQSNTLELSLLPSWWGKNHCPVSTSLPNCPVVGKIVKINMWSTERNKIEHMRHQTISNTLQRVECPWLLLLFIVAQRQQKTRSGGKDWIINEMKCNW
jgi:hypothetical protein